MTNLSELTLDDIKAMNLTDAQFKSLVDSGQYGTPMEDFTLPAPNANSTTLNIAPQGNYIAPPPNLYAGLASEVTKVYGNQIQATQEELIRAGSEYRSAYAQATPDVGYGWNNLVSSLFPMIVGGVMGQPMAGITASQEIDKGQQIRSESQRLAAAQNPMLRFMAERQGNLQNQIVSLEAGSRSATNQAQINEIKQNQNFANDQYGQVVKDRNAEEANETQFNLFKDKEGFKQEALETSTQNKIANGRYDREERGFTFVKPERVPLSGPDIKNFNADIKELGGVVNYASNASKFLKLLKEIPQMQADGMTVEQINGKIQPTASEVLVQARTRSGSGAAISGDIENAIIRGLAPLPLAEESLIDQIRNRNFTQLDKITYGMSIEKLKALVEVLTTESENKASALGGKMDFKQARWLEIFANTADTTADSEFGEAP